MEVVSDLMDRVGIAPRGDLGACRWVAVRHADDHVHIAAVLVRQDNGRRVHPRNDYLRAREVYLPEHLRHTRSPAATADGLAWARTPVAGASPLLEHHRGWGDRAFDYLLAAADTPAPVVHPGIWRLLPAHLTPTTTESVARAAYRAGERSLARRLIHRA